MRTGEAIKKARESKGMTQKELADKLYVDPSLVCRWEKGQRGVSLAQFSVILDVFGMTRADIERM